MLLKYYVLYCLYFLFMLRIVPASMSGNLMQLKTNNSLVLGLALILDTQHNLFCVQNNSFVCATCYATERKRIQVIFYSYFSHVVFHFCYACCLKLYGMCNYLFTWSNYAEKKFQDFFFFGHNF